MVKPDLVVISLGAGVQSSVMYLRAATGDFGRVDAAIFADTQAEPPWVYDQVDRLEELAGDVIPIHRVTKGNLGADVLASQEGARFAAIPARVKGRGRRDSILRRQCTREYKIEPITKKIREMLGLRWKQKASGKFHVEQLIGISLDEVQRVKESRYDWIKTRHPLVFEKGMTRDQCLRWFDRMEMPRPKKSACYFCPYHDDATWLEWKRDEPELFQRAVEFDHAIRRMKLRGVEEDVYLHRYLVPLDEVDLDPMADQVEMFGNECEGMCGV